MSPRAERLALLIPLLLAFFVLVKMLPEYLIERGFPLDDAWIHAVYARSIAETGIPAYNPGIAATGMTAPGWTLLLALVHRITGTTGAFVIGTKVVGFTLHLACMLLVYRIVRRVGGGAGLALTASALTVLHPDLLAASVSGMEVPLAALVALLLTDAILVTPGRGRRIAALAAVAPLARPELSVIALTLPVAGCAGRDFDRVLRTLAVAAVGTAAGFGVSALYNLSVSGHPLPATFYAKASGDLWRSLEGVQWGFRSLLAQFPVTDASLLLAGLGVTAAGSVFEARAPTSARVGAAAFAGWLAFTVASFAVVPPADAAAFYHQRYALPALPLFLLAAPLLAGEAGRRWLPSAAIARATAAALLGAAVVWSYALDLPERMARLTNDARNIDDVQVQVGRVLAAARPSDTAWVIDAGASRYFGNAFVVDLIGPNTPEILSPKAQEYLDTHRPRYLEIVPTRNEIRLYEEIRLPVQTLRPRTRYTVRGVGAMQVHHLVQCPAGAAGELVVEGRRFLFRCAGKTR